VRLPFGCHMLYGSRDGHLGVSNRYVEVAEGRRSARMSRRHDLDDPTRWRCFFHHASTVRRIRNPADEVPVTVYPPLDLDREQDNAQALAVHFCAVREHACEGARLVPAGLLESGTDN
jgi:hypothetical protein